MRLAILGGTFNPVHNGHINIAREVGSRLGYERIVFVPANIPAHKEIEVDPGAQHRLAMLELAVRPFPDFGVDDCELRRGGTSYTIDTVIELRERYRLEENPGLIIGDDLVQDFKTWRDVERLLEMVELIVARRQPAQDLDIGFPCRYIDNSLYPVSSSEIRQKLRHRRPAQGLVPAAVFRYIKRHGLYA